MLVLSRQAQESVIVGGGGGFVGLLKVTVVNITGGKVKLGFEVDATVPVHRLEVWERMQGERPAGVRPVGGNGKSHDSRAPASRRSPKDDAQAEGKAISHKE
jgi:carbon storage regulator CsrA